jgi:hypothetical protein
MKKCKECGMRKHYAKGLCKVCYNRICCNIYLKKYNKQYRKDHQVYFYKKKCLWIKNNLVKHYAHYAAFYHIKILNSDCCDKCGSKKNLQRHHPNYLKPFYIVILCRKCHRKLHDVLRFKNLKVSLK